MTQTFGSPAIWNRVGRYCQEHEVRLETVRRVLSAGAPVPVDVLQRMRGCIHPEGDVHTPYGATESLPVASISGGEVLGQTAAQTREGAGVCVGHKFPQIEWKVIRVVEGPIASLEEAEPLANGQIGELIVRGPVVTRQYVTGVKKGTGRHGRTTACCSKSCAARSGTPAYKNKRPEVLGEQRDGHQGHSEAQIDHGEPIAHVVPSALPACLLSAKATKCTGLASVEVRVDRGFSDPRLGLERGNHERTCR